MNRVGGSFAEYQSPQRKKKMGKMMLRDKEKLGNTKYSLLSLDEAADP